MIHKNLLNFKDSTRKTNDKNKTKQNKKKTGVVENIKTCLNLKKY